MVWDSSKIPEDVCLNRKRSTPSEDTEFVRFKTHTVNENDNRFSFNDHVTTKTGKLTIVSIPVDTSVLPSAYSIFSLFNLPANQDMYDQDQLGSCVSNMESLLIVWQQMKQKNKFIFMPSRLMIYYNGRVIEDTISEDAGLTIEGGLLSAKIYGYCRETQWPYAPAVFDKEPPAYCYTVGQKAKIKTYQMVDFSDDDTNLKKINHLKTIIRGRIPFGFGFLVFESFMSLQVANTGIVPIPNMITEEFLGGHAICAVAWDDTKQAFLCRNEWGAEWGLDGYCWVPYNMMINDNIVFNHCVVSAVTNPTSAQVNINVNPLDTINVYREIDLSSYQSQTNVSQVSFAKLKTNIELKKINNIGLNWKDLNSSFVEMEHFFSDFKQSVEKFTTDQIGLLEKETKSIKSMLQNLAQKITIGSRFGELTKETNQKQQSLIDSSNKWNEYLDFVETQILPFSESTLSDILTQIDETITPLLNSLKQQSQLLVQKNNTLKEDFFFIENSILHLNDQVVEIANLVEKKNCVMKPSNNNDISEGVYTFDMVPAGKRTLIWKTSSQQTGTYSIIETNVGIEILNNSTGHKLLPRNNHFTKSVCFYLNQSSNLAFHFIPSQNDNNLLSPKWCDEILVF